MGEKRLQFLQKSYYVVQSGLAHSANCLQALAYSFVMGNTATTKTIMDPESGLFQTEEQVECDGVGLRIQVQQLEMQANM